MESRKLAQRSLPDAWGPANVSLTPGAPAIDVAWLEPYPDSYLEGIVHAPSTPESRYTAREAVQLAFVAALQQLPPRQRAALMLCDVLGYSAAEAASVLESSTAAINSALQRARETLIQRYPEGRPSETPTPSPEQRELLERYLRAWEAHDVDGFGALLKEDATVVMPPWREWYVGRETIQSFFAASWKTCGGLRVLPTAANGQAGFAVYQRGADGRFVAHSIHLPTFERDRISELVLFTQPRLFPFFGLPTVRTER
jgi:RNA polymerase sigma-70 factor (ECF subfamily)